MRPAILVVLAVLAIAIAGAMMLPAKRDVTVGDVRVPCQMAASGPTSDDEWLMAQSCGAAVNAYLFGPAGIDRDSLSREATLDLQICAARIVRDFPDADASVADALARRLHRHCSR